MKRLAIFGLLWPLIALVFFAGFTDPGILNRNSIWMSLGHAYAWMTVPAVLLGVFDLLFVESRYGLIAITAFAGFIGACTYSIEGALVGAIPTLACGVLAGLVEGRWSSEKQKESMDA